MLWRHLGRVRAWSAAGLLSCSMLGAASPVLADDTDTPAPRADLVCETVSVLDAKKAGDLTVEVRGSGEDRVKMTLKNTSAKRLNVVIPPGLVASSLTGQRGGGGGFQSMGLGSATNRPGTFGEFRSADNSGGNGFQSVGVSERDRLNGVAVSAGESAVLTLPSVCLNYGVKTPTPRNVFDLVDVKDYSSDARVQKALRSLATYGTSQGVAQAVMWNVCNGVAFEMLTNRLGVKMNAREVALASRFVDALDRSGDSELVDLSYLNEGRLYVKIMGDGLSANDRERLAGEANGLRLLGLPVRVVSTENQSEIGASAMLVNLVLTQGKSGETIAKLGLSAIDRTGNWAAFGKTGFVEKVAIGDLDGQGLIKALDRAISSSFVSLKTGVRSTSVTNLKVENKLPFTIAGMTIRAGESSGAPMVPFNGLGIAPARAGVISLQAPMGKVEHVELNGL